MQLAAMKDVFASEMQKREDAYALRIEQAVGTVRDVAVAHVQQETDVVKAVATSEMQQEIMNAQETLSQEYAAKTGERVRMVQELSAKLAALDHHLSVIAAPLRIRLNVKMTILQVRSDDSRRSHSVHQLTLAALGLQSALNSRRSISADMALVMRAAPHDNLVNMMAKSVPLTAASNGVASLHDLQVLSLFLSFRPYLALSFSLLSTLPCLNLLPQCAFDAVATEGRRLSFVPRQGGVVAEAIGSFLAAIPEFTVSVAKSPSTCPGNALPLRCSRIAACQCGRMRGLGLIAVLGTRCADWRFCRCAAVEGETGEREQPAVMDDGPGDDEVRQALAKGDVSAAVASVEKLNVCASSINE